MAYETILVENDQGIVRITLNRPEKRNAISQAMRAELIEAVETAGRDPNAGVVVIRGAGTGFSSGYDVSSGSETGDGTAMSLPRRALETAEMARGWSRIWDAPITVIAQLHGYCLAGGTDLALNCDLVLTAEDATIGFPALRMGGTPPTSMWIYNVGPQWAKRLLITGDTFTGRLAERIGFALEAAPADMLEERVTFLARRIVAMGRDIAGINKYVINRGLELMGRTALQNIAAPFDAIANQAPEMAAFVQRAREIGLGAAFKERDAPFAEGVPLDVPERDRQ
ncbi:MAG: enoyl-CoA hydratase/isomerase family protein [Novosphingobium sp.]|nr:enoyl-CoA hydratase/isomerase family protein [Novosphingobium sp.]MCP5401073.1 enoyl-CoA hydratase/isomerase family protein [Novosphingobium sp.]